jgi:hypothetical protein
MKDFLINLYLLPTKLSYRLAFSFLRSHGFKLQNIFSTFSKDCLYEYDAIYVNVNI